MSDAPSTKTPDWFEQSPFKNHIEANVKRDPQFYYNLGVYVMLYNRIRGDLMNKRPDGASSAFDTEINEIIQKGLTGDRAHVEAFLDKYKVKGILSTYDLTDPEQAEAAGKDPNSSVSFVKEYDHIVSFARDAARAKYGSKEKQRMLTYDDVREILKMKEYRADRPYEKVRLLIDNQDFEAKGDQKDGPLFKAYKNAEQKRKNMQKKIRRNIWKSIGFAAGAVAAAVATVTIGIPAFAGGGGLLSTFFGNLYASSSFAGSLVGIGLTAGGVSGTLGLARGFIGKIGQIWKDRKAYKDFMRSEGKYGEVDENDFEKMGHKRIKEKYLEATALKKFYENFTKEKVFYHGKLMTLDEVKKVMTPEKFAKFKSKLQPWDYLGEPELQEAMKKYLKQQEQYPNGKDANRLFKDAGYHAYVWDRKLQRGSKKFGFYKLLDYMNESVELYETSSLSPDEMIYNYDTSGETGRLRPEKVKSGGIPYISEQLEEFTAKREDFAKVGKIGDYKAHLRKFGTALSDGFRTEFFENAYTTYSIGEANRIATTDKAVKEYLEGDGKTIGSQVESMYSFVKGEMGNTTRNPLSEDIGVGIQYQLDFSEDSLVAGCASLGDNSPEAQAAAAAIAAMTTSTYNFTDGKKDIPPAVQTAMASVSNPNTERYLQHMIDSKLKASRIVGVPHFSTDTTTDATNPNAVANVISSMTDSRQADNVRRLIMSNIADPDEQQVAFDMLDEQILAIETKKRDDARVIAMRSVQGGSENFAEIMKEISELSDRDQSKMFTIIDKKIKKVKPADCKEYLMYKLKDKVKKNFEEFARNSSNLQVKDGNYVAALNEIRTFLNDLYVCTNNGYIDPWQRDIIMDLVKERVDNAFSSYLLDFERYFLTDEKFNNRTQIEDFLTKSLGSSGFAEYLEMNTPESKLAKERLTRMYNATTIKDLMCPVNEVGQIIDGKAQDTQKALRIFFSKDRDGSTDELYRILTEMKQISDTPYNRANMELLTATIDTTKPAGAKNKESSFISTDPDKEYTDDEVRNGSFVYKVSTLINDIDSRLQIVPGMTEEQKKQIHRDRVSALLVMKKRVLAEFKLQMNQLVKGQVNLQQYFVAHPEFISNILDKWRDIAHEIDNKLIAESAFVERYLQSTGGTWTIMAAECNEKNYATFMSSATLGE